jgi:prepilin peptidase CpaA
MDVHALGFPHFAALALCAASAATDARSGRIYNALTIPAAAAGVVYAAARGGEGALAASVTGLLFGVVPFAVAAWRGWIGGGDVKLFGAIGALAGPLFLIDCLFVAFVLAAAWGLAEVVRHAGGFHPAEIAASVWRRLSARPAQPNESLAPDSLLDRPVRMGVFVLAGAVAAALRVAATATT